LPATLSKLARLWSGADHQPLADAPKALDRLAAVLIGQYLYGVIETSCQTPAISMNSTSPINNPHAIKSSAESQIERTKERLNRRRMVAHCSRQLLADPGLLTVLLAAYRDRLRPDPNDHAAALTT
jgi:hypothetical protein